MGYTAVLNVPLNGLVILKGDIDGDGFITIQDGIIALQLIVGQSPEGIRNDYVSSNTDVDGNSKVGLSEVIYIIQVVAGMRPLF